MVKRIFEAIEGMCQAVTYLLILLTGLVIMSLAAFTALFLALRIGRFLWVAILGRNWI